MKILVVDDDAVVRVFVQRVAEHAGHEVVLAEDGRVALALVQSEDPDILITDIHMPELDGFQLVEAIRKLDYHKRLPVICLSSASKRDEVERMLRAGVADYVLKGTRPGDLANRIRSVAVRERSWKAARAQAMLTAR